MFLGGGDSMAPSCWEGKLAVETLTAVLMNSDKLIL